MGRTRRGASRRRERRRLKQLLALEQSFWDRGLELLAGVDEAGRGPLAGPVLAAAVILPEGVAIEGVDDSKRLSPALREELAAEICARAICYGIGAASSREIDRLNILRATHLAMQRAVQRLSVTPQHLFVDGLPVPALGEGHTAIVEGDRLMRRLAARYPGYGWEQNAGYGTAEHRAAIQRLGLTPHHRRSFAPAQLSLELEA